MADTTYDRILKISTKLMSANGFHGTSLQMIAEKAGIAKSTIVHHFNSKEGILVAILDANIPRTTENLMPIVNDKNLSGTEKLHRFIAYHMDQLQNRWDTMNLFLMQSKYLDKYHRLKFAKMQNDYWKLVEQIVVQIRDEKKGFENLDPKIVAIGIIGMMTWAGLWYRKTGEYKIPVIEDHFYRILMEGVKNNNPCT